MGCKGQCWRKGCSSNMALKKNDKLITTDNWTHLDIRSSGLYGMVAIPSSMEPADLLDKFLEYSWTCSGEGLPVPLANHPCQNQATAESKAGNLRSCLRN